MAQYGDQYGTQGRQTDEYGNPIRQATDESTGMTGVYGGDRPQCQQHQGGGLGGMLHPSGSPEEYGEGGRRERLTEKIKEKLPGGGHREEQQTTTGGGYGYGEGGQERKEMMEKIKEKLPGQHKE